jgi:hypothetical protein
MVNLTDLGFCKNTIAETILTTYNPDGTPNAAPMGATMQNETHLEIKLFNTSTTNRNLQLTRNGVLNLTSNITLFYKTTFKETNPNETLPMEWFQKAQTVNAPQLASADATIEFTVTNTAPIDAQKTKTTCKVEHIHAKTAYPQVHCRAFAAAVEAIIHATRVKAFAHNPDQQQQVNKLVELIGNCTEVVQKTAPNSQYTELMQDLNQRITSWRASS